MAQAKPQTVWVSIDSANELSKIGFSMVPAGRHQNGQQMYIGKKKHCGQIATGKVYGNALWYSWDGKEFYTTEFDVLLSNNNNGLKWTHCYKQIPNNAVPGGKHQNGTQMYIGRFTVASQLATGKVVNGQGCWVGYDGKEHFSTNFECLCYK